MKIFWPKYRIITFVITNLFFLNSINAQIALRAASAVGTATTSTLTITKPLGLTVGDLMLATISMRGNNGTDASATNWNLVKGADFETSGKLSHATVLYKVANATDVAASNFSFTIPNSKGSSNSSCGAIAAFSGVDNTGGVKPDGSAGGPFDVTPGNMDVNEDNSLSCNSLSTDTSNAAIVMFGSTMNNPEYSNWGTASFGTLTEIIDGGNTGTDKSSVGVAWATKPSAGGTGVASATLSAEVKSAAILLALRAKPNSVMNPNTVSTANVCGSSTKVPIQSFYIAQSDVSPNLTGLSFTTAGTYAATDISKFQLWTNSTNSFPTGATLLSSDITTSMGTGIHSFASFSQTLTAGSSRYFWITMDVASSPPTGNTISVNALTTSDFTVSSGSISGSSSAGGTQTLGSGGLWLGATSTNWATGSNWCNGSVPTSSTNVVIPSGTVFQPTIGAAAACNNLTINSGATLTVSGSNTLTVSGNWSNSGTFTAGTGTVEYNGVAQTAAVLTYNNLTLSGSLAKTFATTPTVNGILSLEGTATVTVTTGVVTYGSGATLQYNNRGTYAGTAEECTLTASTNLVIQGTSTITLPANQTLNSLTVGLGATLTLAAIQLTINGGLTNNGTINASTGRLNQVATATGDFANTGSIVYTGTGQVAFANNFTNSGTFTLLSSPVTILGANTQSIAGFTTTGGVLMTKTGGVATFAANVNGAGLTMNGLGGTLNLGTGLTHTFTGTWTRSNGTLEGGSSLLKIGGSVSGATGAFTAGTGTVEYNGVAQTAAAVTYTNLILSGSGIKTITGLTTVNINFTLSGTASTTAAAGLTIGGNVTLGSGSSFTAGSFTHNVAGNWVNNGGVFTNTGSTINMNGTTQSIGGASTTTFNNLKLATNASTKTFGRIINVSGALTVNTGVQANLGTFTHTAGSLTLGTSVQGTGASYGGTGSRAANINTTFFAATTGVINVGTCGAYSLTSTTIAGPACIAGASVTLAHTTTSNLPIGTYVVYYTFSGANTHSFNATMNVSTAGTGTFNTGTLSNTGSTSITIDYLSSGCVSTITSGNTSTFTVNPDLAANVSIAASPSTTICSGTNVTFTATPTNGGTPSYQWKLNGVNVGSNSATYSNNALANGDAVTVQMTSTATCATGSPASDSILMTVNPTSVGGTATATASTVCPGSGTTISVTGYTGTIQWQQLADGSSWANVSGDSGGNTATYTTPNLTATTYYRAVITSGSCASALSTTASVTVNSSNTWTGGTIHSSWFTTSNWSCGSLPTAASDVIIQNGSQLIVDDTNTTALANTITVSANSSLTVNSGNTLKVTDKVTNDGGTITFEDTASLVQTNNVANSGNIIYKRTTSTLNNNYDFVYWSSPVKEQKIGKIWMASNWADTFYNFSPAVNNWARTYEANTMTPGKGYISRARNGQQGWDYNNNVSTFTVGGTWNAKFSGVPNNGTITVTDCVAGRDCLLGNPYPSALDADEFLKQNSTVLEGTLYFWTHTTPMIKNAYNSNDYASYNFSGSVATAARGNLVDGAPNDNKKPTGKIAAGQSFFATAKVTAAAPTTVEFNNTMRVGAGGAPLANNQFFRTSNTKEKTANSIEKHRVWLNVSNTQGAFKQTLVGYVTDATNDYDSRFDGESFGGNTYVDFYSINQGKNFTIQGRALPFDQNDTVPLGFKTTIEGSFTIDIDEVDGLLANQSVYLEDKVTNTVSNLKNGNYTFTTAKGTFNDRFVLRYTDTDTTLSIDDTDQEDGILVFYSNNYKTLIIKNKVMDSTVNSVALFNIAGQNIEKWDVKDSGQTNIQIPIKNIPSGIYIVKVKTTKGESSKKIIVN